MAKLIKNGALVANAWQTLTLAPGEAPQAAKLPHGNVLLPLAVWQARKFELIQRQWHGMGEALKLGVWLSPTDDPAALAADVEDLDVIGVHFPTAGDGRGYSIATLLRTRYGYRRELRAMGAIGRDDLPFLGRAGFDAFELADPHGALASLSAFSVAYQPVVPGAALALAA
ncbi:MAG: DUF934 domain-containing protein [Rhodocyclaceae bacterium]|nr:DUF934 domain-containing protein [Rhodocyclaceae bacterium]